MDASGVTGQAHPVPDELFARAVVRKELVTLGALRECLDSMRLHEPPRGEPLRDVLVREGFVTRAGAEAAEEAVRTGEIADQRIERYELLAKIGEGGMGAVHAVMDVDTRELCALKVLPKELAEEEDIARRFVLEGEVACGLRHPNIVGGIRVGEDKGLNFFSMEFVDGETVYDRLMRHGVFPEREALRIVRAASLGLQHAAEHGIVHRDIKPENIMMDHDGTPKLLDLGLVKRLDAGRATRLTLAGMAMGTPHYISPEQARGDEEVDIRSDIYALGGTLYHMVTGYVPFEGNTAAVIMTKHLTEELDWPSDVNPRVSEHTSRLISRMMGKARSDRYARPRDVVADIDLILSGRAPSGSLLPPGASSIRHAVRIARAKDKAAESAARFGSTAIFDRSEKRRHEGPLHAFLDAARDALVRVLEKHRRAAMAAAGVAGLLFAAIIAASLGGGGADERSATPRAVPQDAARSNVDVAKVNKLIARLRASPVESIPSLLDDLPSYSTLPPGAAFRLRAAERECLSRLDAEADRRLEEALRLARDGSDSRAAAAARLRALRVTFARSSVLPRIEAALAGVVSPPPPGTTPRGAPVPEVGPVDLIGAGGLRGWRAYGDWRAEAGVLVFRYHADRKYSRAIQSELGFGELSLSAEIMTEGGTRASVAVWVQSTEDRKLGRLPESAAHGVASDETLEPARGRWAELSVRADAGGVEMSLAGRELAVTRPPSDGHSDQLPLHNGRVRLSLVDGVWKLRNVKVTPLLAEGKNAYEVSFAGGAANGWTGNPSAEGMRAARDPPAGGEAGGAGPARTGIESLENIKSIDSNESNESNEPLFTVADGMRLCVVFRVGSATALTARLVTADGGEFAFRLSGRPPAGQWTALTVPLADFRAEGARRRPEGPAAGARVTGIELGAERGDAGLVVSLVRVVY